jgi:hypothetical protein
MIAELQAREKLRLHSPDLQGQANLDWNIQAVRKYQARTPSSRRWIVVLPSSPSRALAALTSPAMTLRATLDRNLVRNKEAAIERTARNTMSGTAQP